MLLLGFFLFGGLGGAGLGYAYGRSAKQLAAAVAPIRRLTRRTWARRWVVIALVLAGVALLIHTVIAVVGDLLTPVDAAASHRFWTSPQRVPTGSSPVPSP